MDQSVRLLTVHDLLRRPSFSDAELVAGKSGCQRRVRWVHILEVPSIEKFIHGGECILTTGLGLKTFQKEPVQYLKKLIKADAACLCIELGNDINEISSDLMDYANQQHFPLIVFKKEVRFVDITQDINSLLIHQHVDQLKAIDNLSTAFNQAIVHNHGERQILKLLHEHSQAHIFYEKGREHECYPVHSKTMFHDDLKLMNQLKNKCFQGGGPSTHEYLDGNGFYWLVQPVCVLGQTLGYLYLKRYGAAMTEWDKLMTDRAGLVLAASLFQKQLTVERKREKEQKIIEDLIQNRLIDEEPLKDLIGDPWKSSYSYRFIYIDIGNLCEQTLENLHIALKKIGIYPLFSHTPSRLIILAFHFSGKNGCWRQAVHDIEKLNLGGETGVSRLRTQLKEAPLSCQEAKSAAQWKRRHPRLSPFYEENGLYQLMDLSNDKEAWQRFIYDQIGPLMHHDKMENRELFTTLKVYLTHQGSKTKTAEALYIVRQTLYHRLKRIKGCLGEDFMKPERRIPIEVAVRIYELMNES
ncbi:purine catabolism regulator [Scopulibacillus daqui]|uniref:Purine catabolism regulator n=1 Tax=Scopulibacillus daqui TaxID=1469162 RepID=A0ABS2Q177_9BACL|nr:PucR family transcriptional regulator [Scopulibacillus daqui]MBM7646047.1 purine catabolism regulator [Scopulibacillus daqui]